MPDPNQEELRIGLAAFQWSITGMAVISKDGRFLKVNPAFGNILAYQDSSLIEKHISSITHPDDELHFAFFIRYLLWREPALKQLELRLLHKEKGALPVQLSAFPLSLPDSDECVLIQIQELAKSLDYSIQEPLFHSDGFSTVTGVGMVVLDSSSLVTCLNPAAEKLLQKNSTDLIGHTFWSQFPEAVRTPLYEKFLSSMTTQLADSFEFFSPRFNKWFELHTYPEPESITVYFRDITVRKQNEDSLRESERMYRMIANNSTDLISRHAVDGTFLYASPASAALLGYEPDELIGRNVLELVHPEEYDMFANWEQNNAIDLNQQFSSYRIRRKDGTYIWFETTSRSISDSKRHNKEVVAVSRDITTRKQAEHELLVSNEMLQKISTIDALTGVANRRGFDECFHKEWRHGLRFSSPLSIILLDIDYFKRYNDTYGHLEGDLCLKRVANSLKKSVKRPNDFIARYGGEEFVIVLPATDLQGANIVANQMRAHIESLQIPNIRSEPALCITISLGVATVVPSAEMNPSELFIRADKALYQAKHEGRNRAMLYQNAN
ncbi:diguanylate cyclase [Paenibacillus radicis (ex Xue et al. 2023)]|uniref:Diguanylate cyclase n=1 Tax=Paenibacillus radicis (ex Xue et al. 2023) TaxID=2972489 RepID=A0ABT1YD01_9BACL|nr:diguanylate cyclase [Paenibacillus radicis (ex Xue et al. 2023)]MCR8631074.1 diguanylate cyclase [Paenibacillus radicis (ex Xue et al. 2023)]